MAKFFKKFLETKLVVKNSLLASELSAVFENNAAGTDLEAKAKYDNMLPLVKFAYEQECIHTSIITGKEKELLQTFLHIQKVIDNLNKLSEKATNDNERMWYKQQAYVGAMCLSELKEDPDLCHLCNFYQLLMDNWEGLKKQIQIMHSYDLNLFSHIPLITPHTLLFIMQYRNDIIHFFSAIRYRIVACSS